MADVQSMAIAVKQRLPISVCQVLESAGWAGGSLLQLDDLLATPRAEDLVLNYFWLIPFVQRFPDRIPSQFFIADTMLFLDKLFRTRLLIPLDTMESKIELATNEAKKVKMLMSALRTLWRSSTWLNITYSFYVLESLFLGMLFFCFAFQTWKLRLPSLLTCAHCPSRF